MALDVMFVCIARGVTKRGLMTHTQKPKRGRNQIRVESFTIENVILKYAKGENERKKNRMNKFQLLRNNVICMTVVQID